MTLKLALIGIGKVTRDNYIPFLAKQADVTLGYFNRTPERAIDAAKTFGGEAFSSMDKLLGWKPDVAFVLTSETCRYEYASQTIEAAVPHIFFEKPLVASLGQAHIQEDDFNKARELIHRARQMGCSTAMIFNYRFFEQVLAAKRIAQERKFGQVINALGLVHYACWSHSIDLIRHFAGNFVEVTALSGTQSRRSEEIQTDAVDVAASFLMENGASGAIIGTAGMKWQHPLYELTLTFENGRIHLRDLDGTMEILDGAGQYHETRSLVRDTARWKQYQDSFAKSLAAYLDSVRKGQPPPVPGIDGLYELQFEAALKRSIADRKPIQIQKEFPV